MRKILIVEDDQFLVNAYRIKFERAGLEVKICMDGAEALSAVEAFKPNVILLDLVMPKMDGFILMEKLKNNPATKDIKIVIASNLGQEEDVARAVKLGADGYVIKSDVSIADILKIVE